MCLKLGFGDSQEARDHPWGDYGLFVIIFVSLSVLVYLDFRVYVCSYVYIVFPYSRLSELLKA